MESRDCPCNELVFAIQDLRWRASVPIRLNVRSRISIQRIGEILEDVMVKRSRGAERAQLDELGNDPGQVGPDSAGQSGDTESLSSIADASDESVQELAEDDQAFEAEVVDGVEDAADHPERPVHTHIEYGRPDDLPPRLDDEDFDEAELSARRGTRGEEVDVEDLPDENTAD
jgi:hypothetical protein